jgi:hypothetical protein
LPCPAAAAEATQSMESVPLALFWPHHLLRVRLCHTLKFLEFQDVINIKNKTTIFSQF